MTKTERVYIDTSALGPYYTPELRSDAAEAALLAIPMPFISELTEVEMHSLVARKHRMGELDEAEARRVLMQFRAHVDEGRFGRLSVEIRHFRQAIRFLAELSTGLRTLDALHLAIAADSGLEVLTDDQVLTSAAAQFGVICRGFADGS